jgi:hypothetical protein
VFTNLQVFTDEITFSSQWVEGLVEDTRKLTSSRLALIADYAGKTRVVAIGDFYSQAALKPLHDHLFRILRKLEGDCTFDQDAGVRKVIQWHSEGRKTWSFDLKSATDRFPVSVIRLVMQKIFGEQISDA